MSIQQMTPGQFAQQHNRDTGGRYAEKEHSEAVFDAPADVWAPDQRDPFKVAVADFAAEHGTVLELDVDQHLDTAQLVAARVHELTNRNRGDGYGYALDIATSDEDSHPYPTIFAETSKGTPVRLATQALFSPDVTADCDGEEALHEIAGKLRGHRDWLVAEAGHAGLVPRSRSRFGDALWAKNTADPAHVDELAALWADVDGGDFPGEHQDELPAAVQVYANAIDERFNDDGYGFEADEEWSNPYDAGPLAFSFRVACRASDGRIVNVVSEKVIDDHLVTAPWNAQEANTARVVAQRMLNIRNGLVAQAREAGLEPWTPNRPESTL